MFRFWTKIAATSAARVYSLVSGLVVLVITARVLGPEGRGYLVAAGSWVALYGMFGSLSLGQVAQSLVARADTEWLPPLFSNIFLLSVLLSLLAGLVAFLQYKTFPASYGNLPESLLLLAFAGLPFFIWEQNASLLLAASENLRAYNFAQVLGRSLTVLLVIFSVLVTTDQTTVIFAVAASQVLGQAVVAGFVFYAVWQAAGKKLQVEPANLRALLKGASRQHFSTIGAFFIFQSSILLLNAFSTKEAVGIYQLAIQLINVMLIVPLAASMVFYAGIAKAGPDLFWKEQRRLSLQVFSLMSVLAVSSYFLAPVLVPLLAGPDFAAAIGVFRNLLPIVIGLTASQLLASQWISRGIFSLNSALTGVAALANIVLGFYLISRFGLSGAIASDLISIMGVVFVAQIVFAFWCNRRANTFTRLRTG